MGDALVCKLTADARYDGCILGGAYSSKLQHHLADRIIRCQEFEDTGTPSLFYISAWQNGQEAIWYEFASRGFLSLFDCSGSKLAAIFRERILERRVYLYSGSDHRIIKEIYSREELRRIRKSLREEGTKTGMVEAIYKIALTEHRVIWLKDKANVELFEADRACLSAGFLMDVTKEMEAEEQLRKAQAELEAAKVESEQANRVKGEFLANISHEVRTPLNGIMGMCDLIGRTELDRRQREYVHILNISARSLLTLINDILDFSKSASGKLELEQIPFISRNVMEDINDIFLARVAEKNIEMRIDLAPDVPEQLIGDPLRLRQVLLNLIDNALKFTKSGSIHIRVETNGPVPEGEELLFCVKDTGIGIAEDMQEQLFDAFTQADGSTSRKHGGAGLGLAICKRIVGLMNGRIWVESKPDAGSTFYFTARFRHYTENGVPEDAVAAVPERIRSLKVLIVEDNRSTQFILKHMVESFGCRVVSAFSAEEALAAYESQPDDAPFDLLLMDIALPGMDGITAAEAIKRVHRLPAPPIVVISASGRDDEIQRAEAAGIDSYLLKPVKRAVLLDTIMEIFGVSADTGRVRDEDADLAAQFSGARVLVVEDNPINRRVAREILKTADIRVDLVENGADAVAAVRRQAYDVVLMDIQMPGMDGIETTQIIRNEQGLGDLPIIAMTAYTMTGDRERFIGAGLTDYIPKPMERRHVFSILGKYVRSVKTDPIRTDADKVLPEQEEPIQPSSLAGLNIDEAMNRFQGNWRLYADVLNEFCISTEALVEQLEKDAATGDMTPLREGIAQIGNAAARIAADDLAETTRQAMEALDGPPEDIQASLDAINEAFAMVVDSANRLAASLNIPTSP
jgi:signal transduction histidine kinase/DNA-binding response OmpR family regulator